MKKFSKILICLLLCIFGFALTACDNRSEKEKSFTYPSSSDEVVGNGGLAVQKGNYLYFVNGFKSITSDEVKQNARYSHASLMLTKLDNGEIVLDDDGLLNYDNYITISSRLVGMEVTDLFISGDYIYFATQSQGNKGGDDAKNGGRVWAKEIVEFYRIKLDKSSKAEFLYQTTSTYSNIEFKVYETNAGVKIFVYEKTDNKLVRVNVGGNNSTISNVSSVVMADDYSNIFYVCEDKTTSNYVLKKYNIATDESSEFYSKSSTFAVELVSENYVFITYTRGSYKSLDRSRIASCGFEEFAYNIGDYKLNVTPDGVVVAVKGKVINLYKNIEEHHEPTATITDDDAEEITVAGIVNGCVVYCAKNDDAYDIKLFSYSNYLQTEVLNIETKAEGIKDLDTTYFDLDYNYVYFFKTVGSHKYLHRVKISSTSVSSEEMVGVYLTADVPEVEEESSDEE